MVRLRLWVWGRRTMVVRCHQLVWYWEWVWVLISAGLHQPRCPGPGGVGHHRAALPERCFSFVQLLKNLLQHPRNLETRLLAIPGARVLQEHLSIHAACHQSRPPEALLPQLSHPARPQASPAPPRSSPHPGDTPAACLRSKPPATRRRSPPRRPHRRQRSPSQAARARRPPGPCPVSPDSSSPPTPLPRRRRPPALRP